VLVVVYTALGRALLPGRRDPPGWWRSVTGALHPGETPPEAPLREPAAETGLDAGDALCDLARGGSP
jgi:dATP pyrophosphohydrolase